MTATGSRPPVRVSRRTATALAAAAALTAVTVGVATLVPEVSGPAPSSRAGVAAADRAATAGQASGVPAGQAAGATAGKTSASPSGTALLAFAGDVHFEGSSRSALTAGLGSAASVLAAADVAVVNLETAVTDRGTRQPKKFTFRAPASAMRVLKDAGIDAVTVANNHGMDFGRVGLADTLAAGRRAGLPVIGAGTDVTAAFAPYRTTVNGVRIAVLAATDVLDDFAVRTWTAAPARSGLASAKDTARLLAAVKAAKAQADVVAVVLHWGVEQQSCPTTRQRDLARRLTATGASIVVGSHAHVLGPSVRNGRTAVHYGLGNFVFYANGAASTRSGVFTVRVDRGGVVSTAWAPAVIRSGRPALLTGSAVEPAQAALAALAKRCGVAA